MSTRVSKWPTWFVVCTESWSVHYFNGRKYSTWHRHEYYIHPRNHSKNWSDVTNAVFYESKKYHTETMRFSSSTW